MRKAELERREKVAAKLGRWLLPKIRDGYVPQAWVPHLLGISKQALARGVTSGRVSSAEYTCDDGHVLRFVKLADALPLAA